MFTCTCLTCEAKLVVKDEGLVGKIMPCPKCGSMVSIQRPEIVQLPPKVPVNKRFPDVLTHETASGIIKPSPDEEIRSSSMLLNTLPLPDASDKELKTRKILLNILIALSVCLLATLGFLMIFHNPATETLTEGPQPPFFEPQPEDCEAAELPPQSDELFTEPQSPNPPELDPAIPAENAIQPSDSQDTPLDSGLRQNDDILPSDESQTPQFFDYGSENDDFGSVYARLSWPIHEFHLDQQSLIAFVRVLSQLTDIPMTLDIDEMKAHGLSAQTPVSGLYREMTVGDILTQTLATLNLQWTVTDRQILIYPQTTDNVELLFDVSDITGNVAEMIQKLVVPDGNIAVLPDGKLHVVQTTNVAGKSPVRICDEIIRLLEQLRLVRQLAPQTDWSAERIAPEAFGWDRVMEPMTLNHYQPVPLALLVRQLEEQTGLTILVDHRSLHRELVSFASLRASVRSDDGTVNDVLEQILASVDSVALAYRIIDHQTLEITTAQSAGQPQKMGMEVHRYQFLEEELAILPFGGVVVFDVPSDCLFVYQSQPVHRQIRLYLSENELLEP
ncbi:MAG: hypothetical protein FWG73_02705 [Planctomycetaceae bacterium]|nr:hypothetical protein [Planctomycetaceae bacterium]